ncbi:MAG TPA: YibE/F family protein [Candidatus Paceibacterota bacterium]|nr:YibE/F family protein [Candidatus Paceibacterota bacterium]
MRKILHISVFSLIFLLAPFLTSGVVNAGDAVLVQDSFEHRKGEVVRILEERTETIADTPVTARIQTIEVRLLDGENVGKVITFENDRLIVEVGQKIYLTHTISQFEGNEYWSIAEPYRLPWLVFFTVLFIAAVLFFGGMQGLRGLITLAGSLLLIVYVLFPGVLAGYSPVLVSVAVSAIIIIVGSYVTHGISKMTTSAVLGMVLTVVAVGFLTAFSVDVTSLSGFDSDEAVYLNFNTGGIIDFQGLLLGGILIGLLGALYDVAIGQSLAVEELHRIGPHVPRNVIYARAIRMGREHIGALVNTLAIAYAGASLPLLLLISTSESSLGFTLNREVFATEVVRTMLGGIGLVLAVPLTTLIAVWLLIKMPVGPKNSETVKKEIASVEAASEQHSHVHAHGGHAH